MTQLDGFARRQRGANLRRLRLRRRREDCPDGCCGGDTNHSSPRMPTNRELPFVDTSAFFRTDQFSST